MAKSKKYTAVVAVRLGDKVFAPGEEVDLTEHAANILLNKGHVAEIISKRVPAKKSKDGVNGDSDSSE